MFLDFIRRVIIKLRLFDADAEYARGYACGRAAATAQARRALDRVLIADLVE